MSTYQVQRQIQSKTSFWEWLVLQKQFKHGIRSRGYYEFHKDDVVSGFHERLGRRDLATVGRAGNSNLRINRRLPSTSCFTIERLSQTSEILNNDEMYLVKTGGGKFAIFDMREFLPPYLSLFEPEFSGAIELPIRLPNGYRKLASFFRTQWNEHSFIKALHFCGAFSSLVDQISNHRTNKYLAGPSGPVMSRFPFWMRKNGVRSNSRRLVPFIHEGTADLDECLYPRDTNIIIPIEAKMQHMYDLSWHKLAFPCYRFIGQPTRSEFHSRFEPINMRSIIRPVFCAFHKNGSQREAIIHVFPRVQIHAGMARALSKGKVCGVVLNEKKQMIPTDVFRVDLSWI